MQERRSGKPTLASPCRCHTLPGYSFNGDDGDSSTALLHAGVGFLLTFKQTSVVASIIPAHHEVLQAFVLYCDYR
jgi:hypothetical protein